MNKIIQLTEYEYNELCKKANANEEVIKAEAEKLFREHGAAYLDVKLDVGRDYTEDYRIDVTTYMSDIRGAYGPFSNNSLPDELRDKVQRIVKGYVIRRVERYFGKQIRDKNLYARKCEKLNKWILLSTVFAVIGWIAFFVMLFRTI